MNILKNNFNLDNKSFDIPRNKPLCLKIIFGCDEEYIFGSFLNIFLIFYIFFLNLSVAVFALLLFIFDSTLDSEGNILLFIWVCLNSVSIPVYKFSSSVLI